VNNSMRLLRAVRGEQAGRRDPAPAGAVETPAELRLWLFGLPRARLAGNELRFSRRAALALLAYLAVSGNSATRPQLAALLADNPASGQALLRNIVIELRRLLDPQLRVEGQQIWLDPGLVVRSDVAALEAALREADPCGGATTLQAAVEQCRGEFLEGLSLRDAPAFEEWQFFERERLHGLLLQANERLCAAFWRRGQLDKALACGRRMLDAEPWHEGALRAVMVLLLQRGQRAEALAQYAAFCQQLDDDLGAQPDPETVAIYERIASAALPPHSLPPESTPFIGRDHELATLTAWFDDPDCRVVAITGPGGIGKTRLALRAAASAAGAEPGMGWLRFVDGACFVPLDHYPPDRHGAETRSAERLFGAIADALQLSAASSAAGVLAALRGSPDEAKPLRRLLLVLDNVEHLAGAHRVVEQLSAHASGVCVLVTSRGSVPAAQRSLELGALALPATADDLEAAEASRLFLQQARQSQLTFAPDVAARAAIVRICAAAGGIPLGLVQAAQLIRSMPCAAIATLLEDRPLELGSALRNLAPRHRSQRANIAYAWSLLAHGQQQAAQRLVACDFAVEVGGAARGAEAVAALASVGLLPRDPTAASAVAGLLRAFLAETA
jgi:DNA-binding SARP family transcriptional activator/predicted ATPase